MKKIALIILDGFGINEDKLLENAIFLANSKNFNQLFQSPYARLGAHGRYVGLSSDQIGNSQVGHMTIGSGRIIRQTTIKIGDFFLANQFGNIQAFQKACTHCNKYNSNIHILTLFGPGGVHSHQDHLQNLIKIIPNNINIYLHLFGDGRDLDPKSMYNLLQDFLFIFNNKSNLKIASISGRYFAMDRDNNRDRIQKAYQEIFTSKNIINFTPLEYIQYSYEKGITDEFLEPVSFGVNNNIRSNDSIFFLNFRSDRARQLTQAIVDNNFQYFDTIKLENTNFVSMTKYYPEYNGQIFIEDENISNTLGECLSHKGLTQLHIAETEKYAHVTKFFHGGKSITYPGEKDILIPSHKVVSYDLDPAMSAKEIYNHFIKIANNYNFSLINYANPDMVGHTGNMQATISAIQTLDTIIGDTIQYCQINNIELIITADHGNAEEMGTPVNPKTAHTINPVPCWYIKNGKIQNIQSTGGLIDIAPTILTILGLEIPVEITGKNLIF